MPRQPALCPLSAAEREAARVAANLAKSSAFFGGSTGASPAGSANRVSAGRLDARFTEGGVLRSGNAQCEHYCLDSSQAPVSFSMVLARFRIAFAIKSQFSGLSRRHLLAASLFEQNAAAAKRIWAFVSCVISTPLRYLSVHGIQYPHHFFQIPHMVRNSRLHGRGQNRARHSPAQRQTEAKERRLGQGRYRRDHARRARERDS